MVNVIVDPLSDHVGYHILHWIISQSGAWYSKVNENLQDNLRSLETGVAVIDDILTPKEEENPYENQQHIEVEDNHFNLNGIFPNHDNNDHHINILNQIINMNINFNESAIEGRFRGNSGEHKIRRSSTPLTVKGESHMLVDCTKELNSPNSPRGLLIFLWSREKMDNFKFFIK